MAAANHTGILGLDSHVVRGGPASLVTVERRSRQPAPQAPSSIARGSGYIRVNVVSLGTHSRRSRLLFQKALGRGIKVGIFSYPMKPTIEEMVGIEQRIKATVDEFVSYCYTLFVFQH